MRYFKICFLFQFWQIHQNGPELDKFTRYNNALTCGPVLLYTIALIIKLCERRGQLVEVITQAMYQQIIQTFEYHLWVT